MQSLHAITELKHVMVHVHVHKNVSPKMTFQKEKACQADHQKHIAERIDW